MSGHLAKRLAQALLTLFVMSFLVFGLIGLMPGDPIELMAAGSPTMTAEDVARLKALYGVGQPLTTRYAHWLVTAMCGDLGDSRLTKLPVTATLIQPLTNTLVLMFCSLFLALLMALPAGAAAALNHRRATDTGLNLVAFATVSLPAFWLGLVLIIVFAVNLRWLPASGVETIGGGNLVDRARHLVLPVATLALSRFGLQMRTMRAALIDVLRQDWIRTARAKGLSWPQVVWRHALRNALIPVITVVALDFGVLFSGVVVTETVFAYPGMGKLIYDAVIGNDYNLAVAAVLLATTLSLAGSLIADTSYLLVDPRVRDR